MHQDKINMPTLLYICLAILIFFHTASAKLKIVKFEINGGSVKFVLRSNIDTIPLHDVEVSYYLKSESRDFTHTGHRADSVISFYPLKDGEYSFSIYSPDTSGPEFVHDTTRSFIISDVSNHFFGGKNWHIIGVPVDRLATESFHEKSELYYWSKSNPIDPLYYQFVPKEKLTSLRSGIGYFYYCEERAFISVDALPFPVATVRINIKGGDWDVLGNPFPYSIDISNTGIYFWKWDIQHQDFIEVATLEPWTGYYVSHPADTTIELSQQPCFQKNVPLAKRNVEHAPRPPEYIKKILMTSK